MTASIMFRSGFVTLALLLLCAAPWPVPGSAASAASGLPALALPATFQTDSGSRSLDEFRGRKVMLWMFSTWCTSCAAALEAMNEKQAAFREAGLQVIALRNFENGGYPGPPLRDFVERFGRPLLEADNWIFGEVPAEMAGTYNPRRYPDIYFLIDEKGVVQAIEPAPGATMSTITGFVGVE